MYNKITQTVGDFILKARIKKGYSRKIIAEKLNVTPQHICQIEKGKRLPSIFHIAMMKDEIGISPNKLFSLIKETMDSCNENKTI